MKLPIERLPKLLREALIEVRDEFNAPLELTLPVALASLSYASQGRYDIENCHKGMPGVYPLSLFLLPMSPSGTRKSSTMRLFQEGIHRYKEIDSDRYKRENELYTVEKMMDEDNEAKIRRDRTMDDMDKRDALLSIERNRSKPPISPRWQIENTTVKGLLNFLKNERPSAALLTDEAAKFLKGYAMSNKDGGQAAEFGGNLTSLWDRGASDRSNGTDGVTIRNARLTVMMLSQPKVAQQFISSEEHREQGLLARFLITNCPPWTPPAMGGDPNPLPKLKAFNDRLFGLLNAGLNIDETDNTALILDTLRLTTEARHRLETWDQTWRTPESAKMPGDYFLSRMPEHVLRIAGNLSAFEAEAGVSLSTINAAIDIATYFRCNFNAIDRTGDQSLKSDETKVVEQLIDHWKQRGDKQIDSEYRSKKMPRVWRDLNVSMKGKVWDQMIAEGVLEVIEVNDGSKVKTVYNLRID